MPARRPRPSRAKPRHATPAGRPEGADDAYALLTSGQTASYWVDTVPPLLTAPLRQRESCDVCVVGAGIAGLTTAYLLLQDGRDVVVLDDGAVGSGESGRTTAHFTNALDDRYHELERKFGAGGARKAAESHTAAIERVAGIVRAERIRCDARRVDGYLFLHPSDKPTSLSKELKACRRAGLPVEAVETAPGFDTGNALRFPDQLQLHPTKYLRGLVRAIERGGGRVYTRSHAARFEEGRLTANGHEVTARAVSVCTNPPVTTRIAMHAKMAPYRTYVVAGRVPKGSLPMCLWWDTGDMQDRSPFPPYHYVRLQPERDADVLIVGGEDHKTGSTPEKDPFRELEAWARERFPMLGDVAWRWSGQVMEPFDHLAFLGEDPTQRGYYLATGDSGNGMTHGTLAGMLQSDLVAGRRNPWTDLYDPSRKVLRAPAAFVKESADVARKYADYLKVGDLPSAAQLAPGEGAVLHAIKPKAVYRDQQGELHACSAVCPHLGCVVRWNDVEKSFDCPCHGSRFTAYGKVVNGPSNKDLDPVPLDEVERKAEKRAAKRVRARAER